MVKTRPGSSAGPNENMMVSAELKSYLNEQFHNLADKKDITEMKQEIMALVTSMMAKITSLETNINALESKNAILESHIAHLKSNQESHEQYSRRLWALDSLKMVIRRQVKIFCKKLNTFLQKLEST